MPAKNEIMSTYQENTELWLAQAIAKLEYLKSDLFPDRDGDRAERVAIAEADVAERQREHAAASELPNLSIRNGDWSRGRGTAKIVVSDGRRVKIIASTAGEYARDAVSPDITRKESADVALAALSGEDIPLGGRVMNMTEDEQTVEVEVKRGPWWKRQQ